MSGYEDILGANSRIWFYLRQNSTKGRRIADSKLKTKKILTKNKVCVPKVLALFDNQQEVRDFSWEQLNGNFVIKPASGSGGRGVLVVKKRAKWAGEWFLMSGKKINISDLRLHCSDILEGRFSLYNKSDKVLVEERIKIHPKFLRFTKSGTPDIRIIIFNYVPVMAMLRLPQEESEGKANLHQGAIGLGIDLATGITTYGVKYNNPVNQIYDHRRKKKVKVNGIKIPEWRKVLKTAVRCQKVVPDLKFLGVDVILDKEKGPMVLELNARPGLSIQICNRAGLKRRLKRVEGVSVRSIKHGVRIARALFSEEFAGKVDLKEKDKKVIKVIEPVKLASGNSHGKVELLAKADTGAFRSSIDEQLAEELGLLKEENVLYHRRYRSSLGEGDRRPVIPIEFWVKGKKISSEVNVTDRSHLKTKFLIGRQDLKGFLVEVK